MPPFAYNLATSEICSEQFSLNKISTCLAGSDNIWPSVDDPVVQVNNANADVAIERNWPHSPRRSRKEIRWRGYTFRCIRLHFLFLPPRSYQSIPVLPWKFYSSSKVSQNILVVQLTFLTMSSPTYSLFLLPDVPFTFLYVFCVTFNSAVVKKRHEKIILKKYLEQKFFSLCLWDECETP